ncbi:glycosyltransferase [Candidatus Bathyarchaeota archaeon]|nr:glycosyltransferase [Candidatus Bathyarchaeota archaeon]
MEKPLVSVITCAHNEEKYVGKCLASVRRALKGINGEIVFVADRCNDNTAEIAKRFNVEKLIIKTWKRWKNSYAESLQTGFLNSSGKYISIVDADIILPENFFKEMLPLIRGNIASVSARVETYPSTLLNRIIYAWEKTHEITPFLREPRGAARVIKRDALCKINGFKDSRAPDTYIDLELRRKGYRSLYYDKVKVWHIREVTLRKVVNGQLFSGFARYQLKVSFMRTLAHSIFRLRPLVACGWLIEWLRGELDESCSCCR